MKSNESLALKVANQLQKEPLLKDTEILVAIRNREVTITGEVNKFFKKAMVCKIVTEVTGIKNIIDRIVVNFANFGQFPDEDIMKNVLEKFEKNFGNSYKNIDVTIDNGAVTLEGTLKWKYQKTLASECITYIEGIVSIQNNILIAAVPIPAISEKDILAAIYKEESITSDINVDLNGRKVTLVGKVPTAFQKKLIEKIVQDLPGVVGIESKLLIEKNSKS